MRRPDTGRRPRSDGKLTQHTITNQGLYVPAEGGIADFGLQVQALCVLPQFQRLANGQQAFVVARKDLLSPSYYSQRVGRSAWERSLMKGVQHRGRKTEQKTIELPSSS